MSNNRQKQNEGKRLDSSTRDLNEMGYKNTDWMREVTKDPRKSAKIVGLLFMLATVSLFIGQAFYNPILGSPSYLEITYPNRAVVLTGILVEFAGYLGLIFIPILLFPILKIHNHVLAWGYVCFRLFEVVLLSVAQIAKLSLIGLSQDYLSNGGVQPSYFRNMGNYVQSVLYWVDSGGLIYIIVFVIGALMLYYELYKTKLVPRWLSIWGLISAVALVSASLLVTLDLVAVELAILLMIPLAVQEQIMALWLIFKGFSSFAIASLTVKPEAGEIK